MRPNYNELKQIINKNPMVWKYDGNFDGRKLTANINHFEIPNYVFFDIEGFKHGVIIHYDDFKQTIKNDRDIEKYIHQMLGYIISKKLN